MWKHIEEISQGAKRDVCLKLKLVGHWYEELLAEIGKLQANLDESRACVDQLERPKQRKVYIDPIKRFAQIADIQPAMQGARQGGGRKLRLLGPRPENQSSED